MVNDNSSEYDKDESIKRLEKKSQKLDKDIDEMWKDSMFSFEECIHAQTAKQIIDDQTKSLKEMNESEKNFLKLIWMNIETRMEILMSMKLKDL